MFQFCNLDHRQLFEKRSMPVYPVGSGGSGGPPFRVPGGIGPVAGGVVNKAYTSGHEVFVVLLAEFVGIGILAVIADSSDNLGKIAVALMAGWFLIFVITNAPIVEGWISKL